MNRKNEISPIVFGKVPPQSIEAEYALLGVMLLEPELVNDVIEIIPAPEAFYAPANEKIYQAIQEIHRAGSKVDLVTVTDHLRKSGSLEEIGGAYYLMKLTGGIVSSAHAKQHALIVMEKHINRALIIKCSEVMSKAYNDEDCFDNMAFISNAVSELDNATGGSDAVHVSQVVYECLETTERAMRNPGMLTGVKSGIRVLDRLTNGWQKQNLIIEAARPSQGKTALALTHALEAGVPTLIYSLEMSKQELVNRLIA